MKKAISSFFRSENGGTGIEYGLLATAMVAVAITAYANREAIASAVLPKHFQEARRCAQPPSTQVSPAPIRPSDAAGCVPGSETSIFDGIFSSKTVWTVEARNVPPRENPTR